MVRSMKDLPLDTIVYYSESGASTVPLIILSKDFNVLENTWYYELSMPLAKTPIRMVSYYGKKFIPGVTAEWSNVFVPDTMLYPMLEPANSVRLYNIPADYWGLIDDATMGTVSVLGALATGHIGMFAALPFAFFGGLFPVMKAMGGGMVGRWVPLWSGMSQYALGTQLTQADVVGGGRQLGLERTLLDW